MPPPLAYVTTWQNQTRNAFIHPVCETRKRSVRGFIHLIRIARQCRCEDECCSSELQRVRDVI
jgi:hypothetical protein